MAYLFVFACILVMSISIFCIWYTIYDLFHKEDWENENKTKFC